MTAAVLDISNVLNSLLKNAKLSEAELSRKVGLPRATINRLVSGKTPDPRASTLNVIAQYFNVSVDQLLGISPIVSYENSLTNVTTLTSIPIIEWDYLLDWENIIKTIKPKKLHDWVTIDSSIDEGKFALRVKGESMWPQFQEDTILIINTEKDYKNRDFVIAHIASQDEIVFRQLLIENKYMFLRAINSIFPAIRFQNRDKIIGSVIQVRKNY